MSASESELSASFSDASDTSDVVYKCQFQPYEGEPLVYPGEDLIVEERVDVSDNEQDSDGLTPSILESRFDKKVKVETW